MATSFLLQNTASDGSGTITTGGTAQNLFAGATPAHGFSIFNCDATNDLWFSLSTTAAPNTAGSFLLAASACYEFPSAAFPFHAISIYGAVTGQQFTAIKW